MNRETVRSILVVDFGGIGDVLLSTPALKALRTHYRQAKIVSLVLPAGKELLTGLPHIDHIIDFPISERDLASPRFFFRADRLLRLIQICLRLRREAFDMAINLRPLNSPGSALKMAFVMGIIGAETRVGRDTKGRGFFLTHRVSEERLGGSHERDYVLNIIQDLGIPVPTRAFEIAIGAQEERALERLLSEADIQPSDRLVAFHPGAPFTSKRWPLRRFLAVAKKLRKTCDGKIVVIGEAGDIPLGRAFQDFLSGDVISLCGKTTVKTLLLFLKRCLLLITNDTGPMHLAAYVGTPLVAIFHSGTARYYPLGEKEKTIVFGAPDKSSFWERHRVRDRGVLDTVSEEAVFEAARRLLEK